MVSNLLGEVYEPVRASAIISSGELIEREGVELHTGMTFRDLEDRISVFLVLSHDGEFVDSWDERAKIYLFRGHDSVTKEGRLPDQIEMYESGRLSENGKFAKAARAFKEGTRRSALPVQVYEKVAAGVWYDKGIFNLMDVRRDRVGERSVFTFLLQPANIARIADDTHHAERMLSATDKVAIWDAAHGRCTDCGLQTGLRFFADELRCPACRGENIGLLG